MCKNSNDKIKTDIMIDGSICREDGKEIDLDKFNYEFIEWVESKGLLFGGYMRYLTESEI